MTDVNKFPFERANFIAILLQFFFWMEEKNEVSVIRSSEFTFCYL